MLIKQIDSDAEKGNITRTILEALPDWFGIPQAREEYIADSRGKPFFCAFDAERPVGFLYLKETGRHTVEVAVMGVARECHRQGIGRSLLEQAREKAGQMGYSFIQVKTVQMGRYDIYDDTNRFYLSLGFRELEVFPALWDEANPCQVYIMSIGKCQRRVDGDILLEPYYPNESVALEWYQDKEVCRQVDNIDHVYSLDRLRAMYDFLSAHGQCFYIQYQGKLVGDVSLRDNSEIAIVVCREYQNRHIGRKCVLNMIELAKEKGMRQVKANIYAFNKQSQRMFQSIGFRSAEDEWYIYEIA